MRLCGHGIYCREQTIGEDLCACVAAQGLGFGEQGVGVECGVKASTVKMQVIDPIPSCNWVHCSANPILRCDSEGTISRIQANIPEPAQGFGIRVAMTMACLDCTNHIRSRGTECTRTRHRPVNKTRINKKTRGLVLVPFFNVN